jgi:hypothetical protein
VFDRCVSPGTRWSGSRTRLIVPRYQGEFQTDPREALRQAQLASGSSSDGRSWRVGLLTVAVTSAVIRAD